MWLTIRLGEYALCINQKRHLILKNVHFEAILSNFIPKLKFYAMQAICFVCPYHRFDGDCGIFLSIYI